ncbi:hypothetical protein X753_30565 [Mesorhizobium sp. LNJC399B00]|nr:hypothetical protein X753_30565 [Mesorhizobium sp. LNJC399B00]
MSFSIASRALFLSPALKGLDEMVMFFRAGVPARNFPIVNV